MTCGSPRSKRAASRPAAYPKSKGSRLTVVMGGMAADALGWSSWPVTAMSVPGLRPTLSSARYVLSAMASVPQTMASRSVFAAMKASTASCRVPLFSARANQPSSVDRPWAAISSKYTDSRSRALWLSSWPEIMPMRRYPHSSIRWLMISRMPGMLSLVRQWYPGMPSSMISVRSRGSRRRHSRSKSSFSPPSTASWLRTP